MCSGIDAAQLGHAAVQPGCFVPSVCDGNIWRPLCSTLVTKLLSSARLLLRVSTHSTTPESRHTRRNQPQVGVGESCREVVTGIVCSDRAPSRAGSFSLSLAREGTIVGLLWKQLFIVNFGTFVLPSKWKNCCSVRRRKSVKSTWKMRLTLHRFAT